MAGLPTSTPYFANLLGSLKRIISANFTRNWCCRRTMRLFIKLLAIASRRLKKFSRYCCESRTAAGIVSTQWEFIRLNDHQGQFREVLCIGHDVTRLVRKQENLQNIVAITSRQNERLLDFTYIVSHNIRSHVANLSGIINGIDRDDPADMDYSLELLKISVGALDSTIHHLNEIVSIQAATDLPLQPLNLYEEAAKTLHLLQQQIRDTNAEIIVDLSMEQMLLTNPAYLESILLNLLSNALKYRQPDCLPVVRITFQQEPKFGVLRISDNGLGIDLTRNGEKLFKLFGTFHDHKDARGVGLFIVKTQVEALGGKILVESEPGKRQYI